MQSSLITVKWLTLRPRRVMACPCDPPVVDFLQTEKVETFWHRWVLQRRLWCWTCLTEILATFSQTHFELNLVKSGRRLNHSAEVQVKKPASVAIWMAQVFFSLPECCFSWSTKTTPKGRVNSVYWPLARNEFHRFSRMPLQFTCTNKILISLTFREILWLYHSTERIPFYRPSQ